MPALKYTDEGLLATCEEILRTHGGDVTLYEFWNLTGICPAHLQRRFGGWLAVKKRLGFSPKRRRPLPHRLYSRESLIAALKEIATEVGDNVTLVEFSRRTGITEKPIARCCGNWSELRRMAGLVRANRGRRRMANDSLLADLNRVGWGLGHLPSTMEYDRLGNAHSTTMVRRFGPRWNDVINAALAFNLRMAKAFVDPEERLEELRRLIVAGLRPKSNVGRTRGWWGEAMDSLGEKYLVDAGRVGRVADVAGAAAPCRQGPDGGPAPRLRFAEGA